MLVPLFIICFGLNSVILAAPSSLKQDAIVDEIAELCQGKPADIIFALDSSSSINLKDFQKQLRFVENLVDIFDVSSEKTRVGVVSFSNWAFLDFHLDRFTNKEQIVGGVSKITHVGGDTNTAGALRYIRDYMFSPLRGSRSGIPHIIIVLTDGKSNFPMDTKYEAFKCKRSGFSLFAVGVGNEVDQDELVAIASEDENNKYIYQVDNYSALDSIKEILAIGACAVPEPVVELHEQLQDNDNARACQGNVTDIVFSVSPSSSYHGTSTALDFFHGVIDTFDMSNGNLQFGISPKECIEYPKIDFENQIPKDKLLSQIDNMFGDVNTLSETLDYLLEKSFNPLEGARDNSRKVAVLIVEEDDLAGFKKTLKKAKLLKSAGSEIFVIGINKSLPIKKLEKIASDKKDILLIDSYDELQHISSNLQQVLCPFEQLE